MYSGMGLQDTYHSSWKNTKSVPRLTRRYEGPNGHEIVWNENGPPNEISEYYQNLLRGTQRANIGRRLGPFNFRTFQLHASQQTRNHNFNA